MTQENELGAAEEAVAEDYVPEDQEWVTEEAPKKNRTPIIIAVVVAAILALCTCVVCLAAFGIIVANGADEATVTGTVTYRERMALTPDAVVIVQVEDVSRADAPSEVIGEQVIYNPGQVPIAFEVAYDASVIVDNHSYAVRARIEDGQGNLLFTTTQNYPAFIDGKPVKDVELVLERVGSATPPPAPPPTEAYISITEPAPGVIVALDQPVAVAGSGAGLPEGNVVVQVLDWQGNVLVEQPTTLQGPNVGTGGEGSWSTQLTIQAEPGTAGRIYAFSPSPLDNSLVAEASVDVSLGQTEAKPAFIEIQFPAEGQTVDTTQPIVASGVGGGLPEGNVVVRVVDSAGTVLAEQPTILQGQDVGTGGSGTWAVEMMVPVPSGPGKIVAFSPSPVSPDPVALAEVNLTFAGEQDSGLEGVTWVRGQTLPDTEITARFEDGIVAGSAGCNSYQGAYTISSSGGQNTIQMPGPFAMTMMMCEPEVADQETQYMAALESTTSFQVEGNVLTLFYPGGTILFEGQTE